MAHSQGTVTLLNKYVETLSSRLLWRTLREKETCPGKNSSGSEESPLNIHIPFLLGFVL